MTLHPLDRFYIVLLYSLYQLKTLKGMMRNNFSVLPRAFMMRFLSEMKFKIPKL